MRRFFLLLILLISAGLSAQETYRLEGQVTLNGQAVAGAVVRVAPAGKWQQTGPDGKFVFSLPRGTWTLEVHYASYAVQREIHLTADRQIRVELARPQETLETVIIDASAAGAHTPVTHTDIKAGDIRRKSDARDVPYLLDDLASAVSFSDAGNGVGYTGIRIRGISPQQINVSLNGIPLNDPESQSVYWVDIPDFASSVSRLQVQRGVGTSRFGTGAFGANINMQTQTLSRKPEAGLSATYGSFGTARLTLKAGTGWIHRRFSLVGRFSTLRSDGYVDRAFSRMKSYYLAATYRHGNHRISLVHFGGHERTYQAWYGVDWATFRTHPTFNYAGAIYDSNWNIKGYYKDQVDDYTQRHFQLFYTYRPAADVQYQLAAHYTKGFGYYEQYKQDQDFGRYGMTPLVFGTDTVRRTDLVRRKWLDNDFYGLIGTMKRRTDRMDWLVGLGGNYYNGRHFGRLVWARFSSDAEKGHTYYLNTGIKTEGNFFVRNTFYLNDRWTLYTDLQLRKVDYGADYDAARTFDPGEAFHVSDHLFFVNPKLGLTWDYSAHWQFYTSLAQSHREPNRTDYKENALKPRPETLYDWENGFRWQAGAFRWQMTIYGMFYKDQLVYTGQIDNVGYPIRENVGRSYRAGWENEVSIHRGPWQGSLALSLSDNRNIDYRAWDGNTYKNYGNTHISYSPSTVASAAVRYAAGHGFSLGMRAKYVGRQYLDNRNIAASVLPAYHYENAFLAWHKKNPSNGSDFLVKLKIINIFAVKFAANGYMWGNTAYVFPQAGRQIYLTLDYRI